MLIHISDLVSRSVFDDDDDLESLIDLHLEKWVIIEVYSLRFKCVKLLVCIEVENLHSDVKDKYRRWEHVLR